MQARLRGSRDEIRVFLRRQLPGESVLVQMRAGSDNARVQRGLPLHLYSARRLVWSPLRASSDHRRSNCSFQACLLLLSWKDTHVGLSAAVERGPSRARVPGAQDQHGCPSNPFIVGALRARRPCQLSRHSPSKLARVLLAGGPIGLPLRAYCARRSIYMVPPSLLVLSQGWGLIDLPLRATFSPARPRARRDVPFTRRGPLPILLSLVREWPRLPFTARIERAQFHRARSASKKGTWPLPPYSS